MIALTLCINTMPSYAISTEPANDINKALSTNDFRLLGMLMDDMVTISLKNKINIYSKAQAQSVLKTFFQTENLNNFRLQKHGSDVKAQMYYGIGTFKTDSKTFIVYYLLKYNSDQDAYLLKEIKID